MADEPKFEPDDKFRKFLIDSLPPQGDNSLSALAMFEQREYYKTFIYPNQFEAPTPFDLWYNRPMFGKVDLEGNAIFSPSVHMKQLVSDNPNVWVLGFVADAFNDFKTEFLFVNERDVEGTPFELLNPQRGWSSTIVNYDKYMDYVYGRFTEYIEEKNKDSEITSFDKFMNIFYDFADMNSPNLPITLSQYIISPMCSPATSGLMLDVSFDSHGNDLDKYNHFIKNRNFICYTETAQKFGFKVDKNFPGRLIADINSPVMSRSGDPTIPPSQGGQGYMGRYPPKPPVFKRRPPMEPIRSSFIPPTSYSQNPFEIGDKVSFLISYKPRNPNSTTPREWLILRDYSDLEDRKSPAGDSQKIISPGGVTKRALEVLKIELHSHGFSRPKRIVGSIKHPTPQGTGGGYSISREAPAWIKGRPGGAPNVMIVNFSQGEPNWMGITDGEIVKGITFDGALQSTGFDDGYEYGSNIPTIRNPGGVYSLQENFLEIPIDALHLSPDTDPFTTERFNNRVSYPAKLQKYQEKVQKAELEHIEKWNHWDTEQMPKYRNDKLVNKEAWDYYNNPFNQLSPHNLFTSLYKKAYPQDVPILKDICMQFYYSYTVANPSATVTKLVRENGNTFLTTQKVIQREQISKNLIDQKYPPLYWVKQYLLLRNAELENKSTFEKLRIIRRRAEEVYAQQGLEETLKYINKQIPAKAYQSIINLSEK